MSTEQSKTCTLRHRARSLAAFVACLSIALTAGCRLDGSGSDTQSTGAGIDSGNQKPQISGQLPAQVLVGRDFTYTPQASDPDGDELTFSVSGLPDWMSLDSKSGTLRGKPEPGDVGTYAHISISVSDGSATLTLADQALSVVATANGVATLSWMPPTENEDGTPLTDLAGYRIHYGTDLGSLDRTVDITTPGLASYVVENLTPGTWHFVLTAYTTGGRESRVSSAASKTI